MNIASPVTLKSLLLPKEHGSWSLAFEPVVLGLLVAYSGAGAVLAVAVAAGFFTRRPLKLAVTLPDNDPRHRPAAWLAGLGALLALAALTVAATMGGWPALWPLLLATPFGAVFLWFDLRNGMREAEAELAGSIAFAVTPAAFATLAGWSPAPALALAGLSLVRSVPTVLTVRTYLRCSKGQPATRGLPIFWAILALVAVAIMSLRELVPGLTVGLAALLLVRTLVLVASGRVQWPASRVGQLEAGLGVIFLTLTAGAFRLQ